MYIRTRYVSTLQAILYYMVVMPQVQLYIVVHSLVRVWNSTIWAAGSPTSPGVCWGVGGGGAHTTCRGGNDPDTCQTCSCIHGGSLIDL